MKIYYQLHNDEIEIVRCFGQDSRVVLPAYIAGYPVVKAGAYTFSDKRDVPGEECAFVYETEEGGLFSGEERLLAGPAIEEVVFPDTLREIGNYIFYGCRNLKSLEFSEKLLQLGRGAFTGCGSLRYLKVHMNRGKKSCVKEILGELWQRMDVTFYYEEKDKAVLVFPEHYEEAVENTPARILFTQHHGSGNNYRQCFYEREVDYRKFDSLSVIAAARDKAEVLADLAFGRLLYPYKLQETDKEMYQKLIMDRYEEMIKCLIENESFARLRWISEQDMWSREMLEYALEIASRQRKTELLSYLMNEKQKRFGQRRRRFEL